MSAAVAEASKPRKLGRQVRAGWVRDLSNALTGVDTVLVAKLDKVPTRDVNQLRQALEPMQGSFLIVKNSLCRLAFRNRGWMDLEKYLEGTCGVSPVKGDVVGAAKLLVKFAKDHEGFALCGGMFVGQMLQPRDIQAIASLPARPVLLSQLAGVLISPVRNLAVLLQGPIRSLAMTLSALAQKKGKEAPAKDAPAKEEPKA